MNTSLNEKTHAVNKVFEAVFDGKMPSRVPILTNIDNSFCLEYAGYSLKKEQYSIEKPWKPLTSPPAILTGTRFSALPSVFHSFIKF